MKLKQFFSWKSLIMGTLVIALIIGLNLYLQSRNVSKSKVISNYLTQPISNGEVRRTVSASGTLKPVSLIDVGTQISGTIRSLLADFNDQVQAGQLLAEIDTSLLDADLAQAQALQRSAASNLELAQTRLTRIQSLFNQGYVARSEVDDALAAVKSAQASVDQQSAGVQRAGNNRRNAQIRSPVAGTVVSREIAVGQTVAASLQTPVLFKIAKDLREMQIETNVSEADVGFMKVGQKVSFTVDAFADKVFQGTVYEIRNNYVIQQNVVTYIVIVRTRNEDLSLRPGMTGYVSVIVGERTDVMRIPNAALRYEPTAKVKNDQVRPSNQRTVWRLNAQGEPEAVEVTLGLSDSRYTEIQSGALRQSDAVIIGERITGGFAGPKIF